VPANLSPGRSSWNGGRAWSRYPPSTINVRLSAVRKLVGEARRAGLLGQAEAACLTDVPNIRQKVIYAQRLEKVKLAFRRMGSAKAYFLHSRSVGFDGQRDCLKAMQEPLRELKCTNDANVAGFDTIKLAGAQFDLFGALGRNSHDLAILPLGLPRAELDYGIIPTQGFLTKELIEKHRFGPGNDVFVTGRFVHQEGKAKNTPTVRFGNISLMPFEPFKREPPKADLDEVFLVEFRSVGGYSGSPVFLCEIPFHLRFRGTSHQIWSFGPHLLGVDVGHAPDWKRVKKKTAKGLVNEEPAKYYQSHTAMSVVVPAWKLMALLDREDVVKMRMKDQ
jgi:hypothetical protein